MVYRIKGDNILIEFAILTKDTSKKRNGRQNLDTHQKSITYVRGGYVSNNIQLLYITL